MYKNPLYDSLYLWSYPFFLSGVSKTASSPTATDVCPTDSCSKTESISSNVQVDWEVNSVITALAVSFMFFTDECQMVYGLSPNVHDCSLHCWTASSCNRTLANFFLTLPNIFIAWTLRIKIISLIFFCFQSVCWEHQFWTPWRTCPTSFYPFWSN